MSSGLRVIIRSSARTMARRVLFPAVEAVTRSLFAAAGLLLHPSLKPLSAGGLDRVLVLAPHPDDETIGCGGTIGIHALAGDRVTVCIVTDGGRSRAGGLSSEEMTRRRWREARQAAIALGDIELLQMDLPERAWDRAALSQALSSLLTEIRPTIVYTTSVVDYHPEHIEVAVSLADALARLEKPDDITIRFYEVQVPLTPLLTNLIADTTIVQRRKSVALAVYRTQRKSLGWVARYSSYQRRLYRAHGPVEVFWAMPARRFITLCGQATRQPNRFRGIYPRPFTDVAAWLVGTGARLRLRRIVQEPGD